MTKGHVLGVLAFFALVAEFSFVPMVAVSRPADPIGATGVVPSAIYANRDPNLFIHNAGLLTLQVTNLGVIGNPENQEFSAGYEGNEYLYSSGLWVGAVGADSNPHVSSSNTRVYEFLPDIDPTATIYESFEGIRNGIRLGAESSETADDDGDGLIDEEFHNGIDDDQDGRIDEDYEAIGQQMFSCEYRDDTPEALANYPDHSPLNITVRQRSFQWSAEGVNQFVGFDFEVINHGEQRLRKVYLAFFSDSDIGPKAAPGYPDDDRFGWARIDTTVLRDGGEGGDCSAERLQIDTAYMWDQPDDGNRVTGGDAPGYFGSLFLGHTTDDTGATAPQQVGLSTIDWFSREGARGDPATDDDRYALISKGTKPIRVPSEPRDYRYIISAGPFDVLAPGESLNFQTAYVVGDGFDGFIRNAVSAQRVFNGRYVDADANPETGVNGLERCLRALEPGSEVSWDDPCDTLMVTINHRSSRCLWVDADCNPCTGTGGKETLVSWVGITAPVSPNSNITPSGPDFTAFARPAEDRQVTLLWDNKPELQVDPLTGENLFEGYRIWRVDNWQRPVGAIGPSPGDWMLLGEFRRNPKDGLGTRSPQHILEVTDRNIVDVGQTDDGKNIYPVGRYRYVDRNGVVNGKVYYYTITAFGLASRRNESTGELEGLEIAGLPTATEAQAVIPRWDTGGGCESVTVVPNPYRGGAAWDLIPSQKDPTGTKIALRNLPKAVSEIRIYTLAGDLVVSDRHDGRGGDGTYFWNLISKNGQDVVSGIYLYTVEYAGDVCRGRFVILR